MDTVTLKLLVGPDTDDARIDRQVARILTFHKHLAGLPKPEVVIIRLREGDALRDYVADPQNVDRRTRLYADPDVGSAMTTPPDVMHWAQHWKLAERSSNAGNDGLPLFVYAGGVPSISSPL